MRAAVRAGRQTVANVKDPGAVSSGWYRKTSKGLKKWKDIGYAEFVVVLKPKIDVEAVRRRQDGGEERREELELRGRRAASRSHSVLASRALGYRVLVRSLP